MAGERAPVMRVLGGLTGLVIGLLLYLLLAVAVGAVVTAGPVLAVLNLLGLGLGALVAWVLCAVFLVTVFCYILGAVITVGLLAGPPATSALPAHPLEQLPSGVVTGITAAANFAAWALLKPGVGAVIGAVAGLVCWLSVIPPLARSAAFKAVLGWTSWIMPWSLLVSVIGFVLFVINLPFALAAFGPAAIRLDVSTGSIESTGGITGVTGYVGGFNLGTFSFLCPRRGQGLGIQTPFNGPGLSAHEAGHALSVAGFGVFFGIANAVDENVPPLARKRLAYGELIAEGHIPRPLPRRHVAVWS